MEIAEALARRDRAFAEIDKMAAELAALSTEERETRWREGIKRAHAARIAEREAAPHIATSLAGISKRMGWGPRYMEHLCQPYCECSDSGADGEWGLCDHAYDLGIRESD
jgi:hypothetical protein